MTEAVTEVVTCVDLGAESVIHEKKLVMHTREMCRSLLGGSQGDGRSVGQGQEHSTECRFGE